MKEATRSTVAPEIARRRQSGAAKRLGWFAVRFTVIGLAFLWLVPTIGLLISSFRSEGAIRASGWWSAISSPLEGAGWSLEAYQSVLDPSSLGQPFVNTIAVVVPSVVLPVLIAAYAAYGFSWIDFRFREPLFYLFIAMLVVPLQVAFIPLLRLWTSLDLGGSWISIWLTHAGFGIPIAVIILRGFISRLPRELIEAGRSDSASHFQIFWFIVLPLASPAITAYAVFQFLWTWNDVLVALVFLGPDKKVLNVGLLGMMSQFGINWSLLAAGAFVTMFVPLLVFFAMQRFLVKGLLGGAVKG